MTSMFWGLRLEPGKRYSTTVDKSFHVSMAALDCNTVKNEKDIHTVMLEEGESNVPFILCNLQKPKNLQSALDLNFMSGDRLTLFCRGNGTVHLSGYIISEEDDDDDDMAELGEEEEEENEVEDEELEESIDAIKNKLNGMTKKKRKGEGSEVSPAKKKKIGIVSDDDDDESGEEEGDSAEEEADEEDQEEADSDEEASEEDEEEESEEEEETTVKQLQQQIQKTKKQKQQEQQKNKDQAKSPGGKQQQQKAQQSPGQQGKSPSQQGKQQKMANGLPEQGKKTKGGQKTEGGVSAKLEGGVHVQDVKVGNGPLCKPGKMVTVFYVGKLKNNNKVFDETKQGPGFKFRLGQGEVIKGWDVGLNGMKVGGKRVITCPPNMAYGSKGAPPTIPSNSTLVFEVELKAVN